MRLICSNGLSIFSVRRPIRTAKVWSLNNLGETYLALGRTEEALDSLEHAREIFRDIDDRRGQGYVLNNLGEAYLTLDRAADAANLLDRALDLRHAAGDRLEEAETLRHLVRARVAQGLRDQAAGHLRLALLIYDELDEEEQAAARP